MKQGEFLNRIKLGAFMIISIFILTVLIFYIGSRQHVFGAEKKIYATFRNVSGLKHGNAVRFSGVIIGTVSKVQITSDSSVLVTMLVNERDAEFIKIDSEAEIDTEGLLGNNYVAISSGSPSAKSIEDRGSLPSREPLDVSNMLDVLSATSDNALKISGNLNELIQKINTGEGTLGALLTDKTPFLNANYTLETFSKTGQDANKLIHNIEKLTDTLKAAATNSRAASENLKKFSVNLNNDSSTLGKLVLDTVFADKVDHTLGKINSAAKDVQFTSCRVRNSWLVRLFGKNDKKK